LKDEESKYGEYKLNFQQEYLDTLFNDPEFVKRISNLDEITSIPFFLIFNKKDIFSEEIQKQDISCSYPDCPNDLKFEKNSFQTSPKFTKKTITKLESFELIKKPNKDLKIQDLSEDELFNILSFLKARELCEISQLNSVFYYTSNLTNLWKNMCLVFNPDLTLENALLYHKNESKFNIWKQYFIHFKLLAKKSENYLVEKFLSVTNQNFKSFVTSAIDDEFPDKIYSILDDVLKLKRGITLKKEKGTKNLKVKGSETTESFNI
jgi:hypothetical protein